MDHEELRTKLIRGIDTILDAPLSRITVGKDNIRLLKALRSFTQNVDATTLNQINTYLSKEPKEGEDDCCHHGWKKGPLPPDTWHWGGVVTEDCAKSGFWFADFKGDHVLLDRNTRNARRVEPNEVLWYNNCLTLPPTCEKGDDHAS